MKTKLPTEIKTIAAAKALLEQLYKNNETFHPEDDAHTIEWDTAKPSFQECELLNKLMEDIYNLPGNDGKHDNSIVFCPCGYLLDLDTPFFLVRDHSGRGEPPYKIQGYQIFERWTKEDLQNIDEDSELTLEDFINESKLGDEWEFKTTSFENIGK